MVTVGGAGAAVIVEVSNLAGAVIEAATVATMEDPRTVVVGVVTLAQVEGATIIITTIKAVGCFHTHLLQSMISTQYCDISSIRVSKQAH